MSPDEIRAWAEEQRRESAARFPDPVPPLSRVKMDVDAAPLPSSVSFHVERGARAVLNRNGTMTESVVQGLRRVTDDGPLALLVQEDGRLLALRRRYGGTWGEDPGADRVEVDAVSPPVAAWRVTEDSDVLPTSDVPLEELRVRTNNLLGQL